MRPLHNYTKHHLTYDAKPPMVTLVAECVSCARESRLTVDIGAYVAWRQGVYVQQAFPDLPAPEREQFFISGVCPTCWDDMFKVPDA